MRRLIGVLALASLALPACGGGGTSSTRTILVDYTYDKFNSSFFAYFPRITQVHPGQKIVFKQAWSGDAHTVTFGKLLDPISAIVKPYYEGESVPPGDESPPGLDEASAAIPFPFDGENVNQTAGQPCYLAVGPLRTDRKACARVLQPVFTGTEALYSSGFIPYQGNNGNTFSMQLSKSIKPGDYFFYCLMHGAGMGGYLQVRPRSTAIPSQKDVNRAALKELDEVTANLTKAHEAALAGKWDLPSGGAKVDILGGASTSSDSLSFGLADEYYPKRFTTKVGQKVSWLLFGHTVSFHVPKYGPQITFDPKTHEVLQNLRAYNPVGANAPPPGGPDAARTSIDAGNYDGSKFLSSGVQFNTLFSVTFTKAGTYEYACAVHPRQVGTLIVKG